jgi:pimeloyl-ACP methyl ester carboxylesterase
VIVFVHGVPDTYRLWDGIRSRLTGRETVALALPGFGCARPAAFSATKEAYVDFAIGEIERFGEPVHLVGHDWGANLVQRIVSLRPDLVRSWASGSGIVDREYTWHDMAQQWQTPGVGEQMMELSTPEMLATSLEASGVPAAAAAVTGAHFDAEMKAAILRLYRSAVNIGAEWQADVERVTRPALIIWGEADPFADERFAHRLAERVRGELLLLPGCGHWWPLERPAEVTDALQRFWA